MATQSKKVVVGSRGRAKMRIRKKVSGTPERPRISIYRSSKHMYAQIICDVTGRTLVAASTLDGDVKELVVSLVAESKDDTAGTSVKSSLKSVLAAKAVGIVLAKKSKANKVDSVVFDRNGFLYTGRVKALADGAREGGLGF